MEVPEIFPGAPRFSVSVANGSVMVVPLTHVHERAEAPQLHQIPTHVLNEQVRVEFPLFSLSLSFMYVLTLVHYRSLNFV